jgi:DNA-binding cell septation regulator SpoVG
MVAMTTPIDTEILNLRRLDAGSLKAVARVRIGPVVIDNIRIIDTGKGAWCALPQVPSRTTAGGKGWRSIIEITDRAIFTHLRDELLAAYAELDRPPLLSPHTLPFRGQSTWDRTRHADRDRAAAAGAALLEYAPERKR